MVVCETVLYIRNVNIYILISHLLCLVSNKGSYATVWVSFQNYLVSLTIYQDAILLVYPPCHVALKVIKMKDVKGNEASVWTEIDLLSGLDHPNIVRRIFC